MSRDLNDGQAAATGGEPDKAQTISRAGWYAFGLVSLTQALSMLDRNILSILAGHIKEDLGIGDAELGLLYGTVFALFYALFSLPLGRLADGWVRTRLLSICIAIWSVSTGLAAMASGFALLAASRLGVGIGEAAAQPAGTSLLYDYFPRNRRGLAMAGMASAIALGLGLSLVLGGVTAEWWETRYATTGAPLGLAGWQFAFLVAASPGLILSILLWRMKEPRRGAMDGVETVPDPHPFRSSARVFGSVVPVSNWFMLWRADAGRRDWLINIGGLVLIVLAMTGVALLTDSFSPRPGVVLGAVTLNPHYLQWLIVGIGAYALLNLGQSLRVADPPVFAVVVSPSVVMAMVVGALQSVINYGIMGFTPLFIMQEYKLSSGETGILFGILVTVLGILGPMISGPVSDWAHSRLGGKGRLWVVIVSLGLSPFPGIAAYTATDSTTFFVWFIIHALLLTMWLPPLYAIMFDLVLPRMRGMTFSIYLVTYTIFGLGIGPYAVGLVSDANGGQLGMAILSVFAVSPVIIGILLLMGRRLGKDEALIQTRARQAGEPI
ncbi:MFS transporter [Aurantiacibacter xanthus]|nr:MFS transporter [Aurantiacibacter xanthus]